MDIERIPDIKEAQISLISIIEKHISGADLARFLKIDPRNWHRYKKGETILSKEKHEELNCIVHYNTCIRTEKATAQDVIRYLKNKIDKHKSELEELTNRLKIYNNFLSETSMSTNELADTVHSKFHQGMDSIIPGHTKELAKISEKTQEELLKSKWSDDFPCSAEVSDQSLEECTTQYGFSLPDSEYVESYHQMMADIADGYKTNPPCFPTKVSWRDMGHCTNTHYPNETPGEVRLKNPSDKGRQRKPARENSYEVVADPLSWKNYGSDGPSLKDYVRLKYSQIVDAFGEASLTDNYKTSCEWVFESWKGQVFCLYDMTATNLWSTKGISPEEFKKLPSYNFHIGASDNADKDEVEHFKEWLIAKCCGPTTKTNRLTLTASKDLVN